MKILLKRYSLFLLALLFIIYCILSYNRRVKVLDLYPVLYRQDCIATGKIKSIECLGQRYKYLIGNVNIITKYNKIKCKNVTAVSDKKTKKIKCGTLVKLKGKVSSFDEASNIGEFNYKKFNFNNNIYYEIKNIRFIKASYHYNNFSQFFYSLNEKIKSSLSRADVSSKKMVSGIIKNIILNDKNDIDKDIKKLYQRNGIGHILAISGLHIWIIGFGSYKILQKLNLSIKISCILSSIFLNFYMRLIGFGISSFRAYVMLMTLFISLYIGRVYSILLSLSLSAIITLIINPKYIFQSSFVLSYMAVFSIIVILPILNKIFKKNSLINKMGLSLSIAIQLALIPIIAYNFYEVPPYSIFLNIIVIPLMLPLLILGILASLFSLIFMPLSKIFLYLAGFIIKLFNILCTMTEKLPFSQITIGRPYIATIIIYYFILAIMLIMILYFKNNIKWRILLVFSIVMWCVLCYKYRDDLLITMLDVGQGECIVIQNKKEVYVIDGGSTQKMDGAAMVITNFLKCKGYNKINIHILTHSDLDHLLGIKNMLNSGYKIDRAFLPEISNKDKAYLEFENLIKSCNIDLSYIHKGNQLVNKNLIMLCLHPVKNYIAKSANEYSTVLYLKYHNFDMLLTGDLEKNGEALLNEIDLPKMDVLKVAHHGSKNSTYDDFLENINPQYAIISCGKNNRYGHPHKDLMKRLKDNNIYVFRTDINGAIEMNVKKNSFKISCFKK